MEDILQQVLKKGERFDISDIDLRFTNLEKKRQRDSNHLIEKLVGIGRGRYEVVVPPEPAYPYLINSQTGHQLKLNIGRNQYDAWSPAGVTIAPHKLLGFLIIKNKNPFVLDIIDHMNEDKKDFRLSNLRWTTNGGNVREAQANKIKKQSEIEKLVSLKSLLKEGLENAKNTSELYSVCEKLLSRKESELNK
tara:strand:+ start:89 stop:664 length:576 start_codon:yes stop_codon:yes gene_type:complete